jgi:hypothetical protein
MEKLLSIGDLFKKSWEIYQKRFWLFMGILAINLPFLFIGALFSLAEKPDQSSWHNPLFWWGFGGGFIIGLVALVISFWSYFALILSLKEENSTMSSGALLRMAWSKLNSYVWVVFLADIIVGLGFLLLIIPGIIFVIWFMFAALVFVFEDVKGMVALKRSKQLAQGNWWAIFGRMFLFGLAAALVSFVTSPLFLFGQLVMSFVVMPMAIVYKYFIYQDLKRLKSVPIIPTV